MLAENIVLYLQNTHFVLLFNILCIEFHKTFCEASLSYSQHSWRKKLRYFLLWKGEKSKWCKDWGWCKDRSMTVHKPKITWISLFIFLSSSQWAWYPPFLLIECICNILKHDTWIVKHPPILIRGRHNTAKAQCAHGANSLICRHW